MPTQWGAAWNGRETEGQRPGFFKGILQEIGRDLKGTARVIGAIPGTILDPLPNFESPLTFEDLTSRDWQGAAFTLGGLVVPGASAAAASGRLGVTAAKWLREGTRIQQVLRIAGAETAVGATVGALRPLEDGDSRLGQVLGDAAIFGIGGGVFEGLGQTFAATVGAQRAVVQKQLNALQHGQEFMKEQLIVALNESAGIKMYNPATTREAIIRRMDTGEVGLFTNSNTKPSHRSMDFNTVLSQALQDGYFQPHGVARTKLDPTHLTKLVPEHLRTGEREGLFQEFSERLTASGGVVEGIVPELQLSNYASARAFLRRKAYSAHLLDSLAAEAAIPFKTEAVVLPKDVKASILQNMPPTQRKRLEKAIAATADDTGKYAVNTDSMILREGITSGAISIDSLADGATINSFMRELIVNDQIPRNSKISATLSLPSADAGLLAYVMSKTGMRRWHPEASPILDLMGARNKGVTLALRASTQLNEGFRNTVAPKDAVAAMKSVLAQSGKHFDVARADALAAAKTDGEKAALKHVFDMTQRHQLRQIATGALGEGILSDAERVAAARQYLADAIAASPSPAAFDPNAIPLPADGPTARALQELRATAPFEGVTLSSLGEATVTLNGNTLFLDLEDASAGLREIRQHMLDAKTGSFTISSNASLPGDAVKTASLKEAGLLARLLGKDELTFEFAVKNAKEADAKIAEIRDALTPAKVNLAQIISDPYKALDLYALSMEHKLAYKGLTGEVEGMMETLIPSGKTRLKDRLRSSVALMTGKKTGMERIAEATLAKWNVPPGTIRKYSSLLRSAQSNLKLGGIWSGIVNSTQMINITTKLGMQGGADALSSIYNKNKRDSIMGFIHDMKIDTGFHMSPLDTGVTTGADSLGQATAALLARAKHINFSAEAKGVGNTYEAAKDVLERAWMWSFNSAEASLRFGSVGAVLQKHARAKGVSLSSLLSSATKAEKEAVAREAETFVKTTQFDYSSSNMPELLQGPFASVLGQFKSFIIFEAEFLGGLNAKEQAAFTSALIALGGFSSFLNLPGADFVDAGGLLLYDKKLSEALGAADLAKTETEEEDKLTRLAAYGLPGLANVDLSNYLGPGSIWEMTRGLLGPTAGDIGALTTYVKDSGTEFLATGTLSQAPLRKFMREVMPSQLRRLKDGINIMRDGDVRNPYSGKLLYRPEERMHSAIQTMIGAPMADVESSRAVDDFIQRQTEAYRTTRESYRRQIATSLIRGDTATATLLQNRAQNAGISFTPADVRRAVTSFQRDAEERRSLRTPLDLRQRFLDEMGDLE